MAVDDFFPQFHRNIIKWSFKAEHEHFTINKHTLSHSYHNISRKICKKSLKVHDNHWKKHPKWIGNGAQRKNKVARKKERKTESERRKRCRSISGAICIVIIDCFPVSHVSIFMCVHIYSLKSRAWIWIRENSNCVVCYCSFLFACAVFGDAEYDDDN